MKLSAYAGVMVFALASATVAPAQLPTPSAPPHFEFETLASGFNGLTDFVPLVGGGLLVAQQDGVVRHFGADGTSIGIVLDWRNEVAHHGERGLMSIATLPGFVADGGASSWLYLYYTAGPDGPFGTDDQTSIGRLARTRLEAVTVGGVLTLREVSGAQQILLGEKNPDGTAPTAIPVLHESHMGGSIVFGSDGTLLLSTGDGASFFNSDVGGEHPWGFDDFVHPVTGQKGPLSKLHDQGSMRAQDPRTMSGKVLRIDPHTGLGLSSNPFFDGDPDSVQSRVWALGLRNPFRMARIPGTGSSNPAVGAPGTLICADVGSWVWEELDVVRGGENFGWPCIEGSTPNAFFQAHQPPANPYGWVHCGSGAGVATSAALAIPRTDPAQLDPPGVHVGIDGSPLGGFTSVCVVGGQVYAGASYPATYAGRYVFGDFAFGWIKAAEMTPAGTVASVIDFLDGLSTLVAVHVEPGTGDLLFAQRGNLPNECRVLALRFGKNQLPIPQVAWSNGVGGDPLAIAFDATGTIDPDGDPLTYGWDFGDGSPLAQGATVEHTYADPGIFKVTLTVNDGFEAVSQAVYVLAGTNTSVALFGPLEGTVAIPNEPIALEGLVAGPAGAMFHGEWRIDRFVDGVWTIDHLVLPSSATSVPFDAPAGDASDWYWRVRLVGLQSGIPVAEQSAHVHPSTRVHDAAGTGLPLAKVLDLVPPGSQGFGSHDVEVWRDLVVPGPGASANQQYATYHPDSVLASQFDWIGYEFSAGLPAGTRTFAIEFTDGLHVPEGGWFLTEPVVQVRVGGTWQAVPQVTVTPPYPPNGQGAEFTTYRFSFPPIEAQAVRLIGRAGGTERFLSVAELRVLVAGPPGPWRDLTPEATAPLSNTLDFLPPGPQGFGSIDLERLRDGSVPPPGSASILAQVTTFHSADPGVPPYFGWRFDEPRTFVALRFTEGIVIDAFGLPLGGWFTNAVVQTRLSAAHPWQTVQGLVATPPYRNPGPGSLDYETYVFSFTPRVARHIRIVGLPGGLLGFASAAELRVLGPHGFDGGWTSRTGLGLLGDKLAMSSATPPVIGLPIGLHVEGAPPSAPGLLGISLGAAAFPYGEITVLVDPVGLMLHAFPFDGAGAADIVIPLPPSPALVGFTASFQTLALDFSVPNAIAASNALDMTISAQ